MYVGSRLAEIRRGISHDLILFCIRWWSKNGGKKISIEVQAIIASEGKRKRKTETENDGLVLEKKKGRKIC